MIFKIICTPAFSKFIVIKAGTAEETIKHNLQKSRIEIQRKKYNSIWRKKRIIIRETEVLQREF